MNTSAQPELNVSQAHSDVELADVKKPEKFFPSGAIAFFISLIILCLIIWFGVYFLMIERI